MSAPVVTIGGKVVYTSPDAPRARPAMVGAPPASERQRLGPCRKDRIALIIGLATAAGLLILLWMWAIRRDRSA